MKKLTNIFAWTLVICVLLALVTSCKVEDKTSDKATDKPSDTVGTDNAFAQGSQESGNSETGTPTKHGITIDETVLVDEKGVKITALSLDPYDPLKINISIENNSGKDLEIAVVAPGRNNVWYGSLYFGGLYSYVNAYSVRSQINGQRDPVIVKDGEKSYNTLDFVVWDEMKKYVMKDGIVADFETAFQITDPDPEREYLRTYLKTGQIKIKTSAADTYDYSFDDNGILLYDDKDIKLVFKGIYDGNGYPTVLLTVDNNSDKNIEVICDNLITEINGHAAGPWTPQSFYPLFACGKNSVGVYRFVGYSGEMEICTHDIRPCPHDKADGDIESIYDGNIESIKKITTGFIICDIDADTNSDDYFYAQTGPITLNIEWQDGKPAVTLVTDDAK